MIYRRLGKTGFRTSALGLGGESALYRHSDRAVQLIEKALKLGVNYFDTAPGYEESELNFGEVLPRRRKQMFIATKTDQRGYSSAWRQFERSLKRLKVDRVDLLQLHHLSFPQELDMVFSPRGAVRMVHEAKEQGLTRFVGVTGHHDPDVLLGAIKNYPFDTILMALNPADVHLHSFQTKLLPAAVRLHMGIMAMKVMARGRIFPVIPSARALISYDLMLPISNVVVGVMNEEQLVRNAEIVDRFIPLSRGAIERLEEATAPYATEINFYRKDARGDFPTVSTMTKSVL